MLCCVGVCLGVTCLLRVLTRLCVAAREGRRVVYCVSDTSVDAGHTPCRLRIQ